MGGIGCRVVGGIVCRAVGGIVCRVVGGIVCRVVGGDVGEARGRFWREQAGLGLDADDARVLVAVCAGSALSIETAAGLSRNTVDKSFFIFRHS